MKLDNILESKIFRGVILTIAGLIVLGFVFGMGIFVGTKRADFSFRWADQYHRNFGGPQNGVFGEFANAGQDFSNGNGCFGKIINVDQANKQITIKSNNDVEKKVLIDDKTIVVYQRRNLKLSDLKNDDVVVVIGEPNSNGQIEGELIRILPSPMQPLMNSPSGADKIPAQTQNSAAN